MPDVPSDLGPTVAQGGRWRAWRRPVAVAVAATAVLRVVATVVALVSADGVAFPHLVAAHPSVLVDVWSHWDTGYYLTIAEHGYPAATAAGHHGVVSAFAAFGPAYPATVAAVHAVTRTGWMWSSQLVSLLATVAALVGLVRLADRDLGPGTTDVTVTLVVAFPTAFFLLASYPESLALAFVVWSFLAARAGRWWAAGVLAAGATMTNFYLVIVVVALLVEVYQSRPSPDQWPVDVRTVVVRALAVAGPAAVAVGVWMVVCDHLYADPLAFVHAQADWNRHFAFPWTLAHRTLGDLVHLRFLDTSVASVTELFDSVTVVLLAVVAVVVFVRVRRSYGVLLGAAWCVYTFQTILYSETREVLVLFPFFMGMARGVAGHPWRERLVLACFIPSAYFLIDRFVNGRFAG